MTIGPIQIRWTKTVKAEQARAQVYDQRHSRLIAGQYHDIQALRATVEVLRSRIIALDHAMTRGYEQKLDMALRQRAKTPKGAGAAI